MKLQWDGSGNVHGASFPTGLHRADVKPRTVSKQALKPDPSHQQMTGHVDGMTIEARLLRSGWERMVDVHRHA
jgi:hypothetical protein